MKTLVTYASRHGATRGIAERIAQSLERSGLDVDLQPADGADPDADRYDAFVIGSAAYVGRWLPEAARFVERHRARLAECPVWLFSSGPTGTETVDAKGRDVLVAAEPREFGAYATSLHPRGQRVFFGAFDPDATPVGMMERFGSWFMRMPAIRGAVPAGDFRDWPAIDAWAADIARELHEIARPTAVSA